MLFRSDDIPEETAPPEAETVDESGATPETAGETSANAEEGGAA